MRALVTGGNGFVGRHLVDHLADAGDDVTPTDHRSDGVDITEPSAVRTVMERVRPDVVYHLAGWSDVGASWDHPYESVRVNVVGTQAVLEASQAVGVDRVVVVTSADVYGRGPADGAAIGESEPLLPVSPYAAGKAAAEMMCLQAHLAHGTPVVRARAFNHLGPGQSEAFVAPAIASRLIEAEHNGSATIAVGNLDARRDFTDVRDVVRAYRSLAVDGRPGEAYNVCSGTDVSISELVDRMLELLHTEVRLEVDPALVRPVDIPVRCGDATKLTSDTGWRPTIPLDTTLADVLDDLRTRHTPAPETTR